jgi:alpha-L-fucosidase
MLAHIVGFARSARGILELGGVMTGATQRWFADARFGLFVHWGMYALYSRGEQVLFREHLKPSLYRQRAAEFRADRYDPAAWAALAREAGMRYAVLTAKHHDGFCLFDSAVSDLSSAKTGAGRDLLREYVDAFRAAGLHVGIYYSLADWQWPAYFQGPKRDPDGFARFLEYTHAQVRELCSNYGMIDILWFDGAWPHTPEVWRAAGLLEMIRSLQPNILINDRTGLPGDFDSPEQHILGGVATRPWESCITAVERHWGYHAGERLWKSPAQVIHMLAQVAEGGGNLVRFRNPLSSCCTRSGSGCAPMAVRSMLLRAAFVSASLLAARRWWTRQCIYTCFIGRARQCTWRVCRIVC